MAHHNVNPLQFPHSPLFRLRAVGVSVRKCAVRPTQTPFHSREGSIRSARLWLKRERASFAASRQNLPHALPQCSRGDLRCSCRKARKPDSMSRGHPLELCRVVQDRRNRFPGRPFRASFDLDICIVGVDAQGSATGSTRWKRALCWQETRHVHIIGGGGSATKANEAGAVYLKKLYSYG